MGTPHLRSSFPLPPGVRGFPSYLREAGYFTTNNVKTDYNTADERELIETSWDRSSATAHWRDRPEGKPFFAVFNLMTTHQSRTSVWSFDEFESEIGSRISDSDRSDPELVPLPPFYPDTPLVRRSMARYYDCIHAMDKEVGALLAQLKEDGLEENTIIFFYSDHGMGMPRGKRVLHDSGMRVPLLIHVPEAFKELAPGDPGSTTDRLVSFVDFAPTLLSLLGLPIPEVMQGEPFLGKQATRPRDYVYGARDRVDEAYDLSRSVRDKHFLYIRNYMPHLSWMQPEGYSDAAPMRNELARLAAEGLLDEAQMSYASAIRPTEELYDTLSDPFQIHNLAKNADYDHWLSEMREAHRSWLLRTRDVSFLPETEVWRRSRGESPRTMAVDFERYDLEQIVKVAANRDPNLTIGFMDDPDPAKRYWAVLNLRQRDELSEREVEALLERLDDSSPPVRLEAAMMLMGNQERRAAIPVLRIGLQDDDLNTRLYAARCCQMLGKDAAALSHYLDKALDEAWREEGSEPLQMYIRFALDPLVKLIQAAE